MGGAVFDNVREASLSESRIRGFERVRNGVDWGWFPDPWRFVRCAWEPSERRLLIFEEHSANKMMSVDTGKVVVDSLTFTEFTLKEFERDKEDNWIDEIPDGHDHSIQEFVPALRAGSQAEALRIALQVLGDLTGFGIQYFDFDNAGYVKTATEMRSDNSQLMRNIARHEHALERSIAGICRSLLSVYEGLGESIPDEGSVRVDFDDSVITDTAAEKRLAMFEVGVTTHSYEYRMRPKLR